MENNNLNDFEGILVTQNQQEFILGIFTIRQVLKFTKYTERLIVSYDDDNNPNYNDEIQRKVEPGRVEKIADFLINDPNAIFPTNIVLSIPMQVLESQETEGNLIKLKVAERVFKEIAKEKGDVFITIIDGQHRIRGIERAIERIKKETSDNKSELLRENKKELLDRVRYLEKRMNDLLDIQLVVSFFIDKTIEYKAMIF